MRPWPAASTLPCLAYVRADGVFASTARRDAYKARR